MRVHELADWEVVGPEGEFYGRYKTKPPPDKIPLYAIAKKIDPGEWRMELGALSPASPYVIDYRPQRVIHTADGKPVAEVDKILWIAPGFGIYPIGNTGLGAAIPETVVHPRKAITTSDGTLIAIVEGVGKVHADYHVRPVTVTEAALTSRY